MTFARSLSDFEQKTRLFSCFILQYLAKRVNERMRIHIVVYILKVAVN